MPIIVAQHTPARPVGQNYSINRLADALIPTIFHEPWWLDIATAGQYRVVEVSDGGRIVARMPYFIHRKLGFTISNLPPLTHFLGPASAITDESPNTQPVKQLAITQELIRKLPAASEYYIKCHRGITDIIGFQKEGFRTSVQFTYEVASQPVDKIWNGLLSRRRSVIKGAQNRLLCQTLDDPAEFVRFSKQNLNAFAIRSNYSLDICRKLIQASLSRGCGRIIATRDKNGELATAIFCVWDQLSYYFLIGTRRPEATKGSLSLLVWEAIKDAARQNRIFDMDGLSNDESVSFYSSFGAAVAARYIAIRDSKAMRVARTVQSLFKRPNYYC